MDLAAITEKKTSVFVNLKEKRLSDKRSFTQLFLHYTNSRQTNIGLQIYFFEYNYKVNKLESIKRDEFV